MLQLVEYRIKWIVKNNHAIKTRVPIYKDVGRGAVNKLTLKPLCSEDSSCGCHFGETFHADGKCACDIARDILKKK